MTRRTRRIIGTAVAMGLMLLPACADDQATVVEDGSALDGSRPIVGEAFSSDRVPVLFAGLDDDHAYVATVDAEGEAVRLPPLPGVEWIGEAYAASTEDAVYVTAAVCASTPRESDVGYDCAGSVGDSPLLFVFEFETAEWVFSSMAELHERPPQPVYPGEDGIVVAAVSDEAGSRRLQPWSSDGVPGDWSSDYLAGGSSCSVAQLPVTEIDLDASVARVPGQDPGVVEEYPLPGSIADQIRVAPWGSATCASAGPLLATLGVPDPTPNVGGDEDDLASDQPGTSAPPGQPIRLHDLRTGETVLERPYESITALMANDEDALLVTETEELVIDLASGEIRASSPAVFPSAYRAVTGGFLRFDFSPEDGAITGTKSLG